MLPYLSIFSLTALVFVGLPLEFAKHYSIFQTGMVLASFYIGTMIAPLLFYRLLINSVTTRLSLIMNITAVSSLFISLYIVQDFYLSMVSLFLLGIGKNIVLTFYDSKVINRKYHLYRGIGSIGFVATALNIGLGYISLTSFGIILASLFLIIYLSLFFIKEDNEMVISRNLFSMKNIFEYKYFWSSILFHRIGMGLFISFSGIFVVHTLGYTELDFSVMWILAASLEMVVLLLFVELMSVKNYIYISLFATIVRFLLIFLFPEYYFVLLISQSLHIFSYAIYHVNILKVINRTFKERTPINLKVYHSISEGLALVIGSFIGIYINDLNYFFLILSLFTIVSILFFKASLEQEGISTEISGDKIP